ncbi:MAG: hypothetical protein NZM44_00395 [Candidatus Calescibacterium sp.]|nr:hypothetical protein [Candidatus Calescibacterium sp.]
MDNKTKEEILTSLIQNQSESKRIYVDPKSNNEFHIEVSNNLSSIIKTIKLDESVYKQYKHFVVEGKHYEIEKEVIEMCYRCKEYVILPQLSMEDWLLLSVFRADLIIALNAEISDMLFEGINNLSANPLASQISINS